MHPSKFPARLVALLALAIGVTSVHAAPKAAKPASAATQSKVLQQFSINEPLARGWDDELVSFDFAAPATSADLFLTPWMGNPVAAQFENVKFNAKTKRVSGRVWTVATLEPGKSLTFELRQGKVKTTPLVSVKSEGDFLVLSNEMIAVRLPQWKIGAPVDIKDLPAPLSGVCIVDAWARSTPDGPWLGGARWVNGGATLRVKSASSEIIENGTLRAGVRQKFTLEDGRSYEAVIRLASRQDAAMVTEESNIEAGQAAWRFSFKPGLDADHVYWHNQWKASEGAKTWALTDTEAKFDKENVIAKVRPWSFWWLDTLTMWAGFYKKGAAQNDAPFVGILATRPSSWFPNTWNGFDRTEIPITARAGGELDLTFSLVAMQNAADAAKYPNMDAIIAGGKDSAVRLHREWAITVGTVGDNIIDPTKAADWTRPSEHNPAQQTPKLRRQLLKYSEFPLNEVKDYNFDFTPDKTANQHPFLVMNSEDIARVRLQAKSNPAVKAQVDASATYVTNVHASDTLQKEGAEAFYTKNYIGNYLVEALPEAYIGSDDPAYGKLMAAAVPIMAREVRDTFLDAPTRPAIGSYGPWFSENFTRLLFFYDLIAGKGLLSPEDDRMVRHTLVLGAHLLAHRDFWNPDHGLASANPNMTSSIRLPRGLLGLFLAGHPESNEWLKEAEDELKLELKDWISPGGAWIESPGYQAASEDGMMLLAAALRNTGRHDYFADPQMKALHDYYGFLLTPPDRRFPPRLGADRNIPTQSMPGATAPMTIPAIGDTFAGMVTPFNGWMAEATAKSDPAYSARQQWFWKMQNFHFNNGNRAKSLTTALTDAELPAAPPAELSRGFPGFGSTLRTSWTDPRATYVAHRTGPSLHHYHSDFNSLVLYSKGAPLALDFGNLYSPVHRRESPYHNMVSFAAPGQGGDVGTGNLIEMRSLPATLDYSYGLSSGGGNQKDHRFVLLVKSRDPLGANYVVVRDRTEDGQPNQQFSWNLWCLAKAPEINGNTVHFPGQFDVDLDVHLLSPAAPQFKPDNWKWEQHIYVWGPFTEEQNGVHVGKSGSTEDYFAVLYPRAAGQVAANITTLAQGAGSRIAHMEGTDVVLLSPDKPAEISDGDVKLQGEIAFARRYNDGTVRLAVVRGQSSTTVGDWSLSSSGAASIEIKNGAVSGESSGQAHEVSLSLPANFGDAAFTLDGKAAPATRRSGVLSFSLPAGAHTFAVAKK